MNRSQLRSFHVSAELGGFTAASRALRISQPTITTQVRSLEEEYGVELFVRQGRNVRLTSVGEDLYEITKRVILHENEARGFSPSPTRTLGRAPETGSRGTLSCDRCSGRPQEPTS